MKYIIFISLFCISYSCKKIDIASIDKIQTDEKAIIDGKIVLKGVLVDSKENSITQYGHCWSLYSEPTLLNSDFTAFSAYVQGSTFESEVFNLELNKTYYYRTYSINQSDTTYFEILSFSTTINDILAASITINNTSVVSEDKVAALSTISNLSQFKILQYGLCWSSVQINPSILDNHSILNSNQVLSFSDTLSNLLQGVAYHIRSYVKLDDNIFIYSNSSTITIEELQIETVTYALNNNMATLEGKLNQLGVGSISDHGFCWSTLTSNPIYNNDKIQLGVTSSLGSFFGSLPLQVGNTYYFRAYAVVNNEIKYGIVKSIAF